MIWKVVFKAAVSVNLYYVIIIIIKYYLVTMIHNPCVYNISVAEIDIFILILYTNAVISKVYLLIILLLKLKINRQINYLNNWRL